MRARFFASVGKYPSDGALNEDAAEAVSRRGLFALSDGASDSYNSARWARLLTRRFVSNPMFDENWLRVAVTTYADGFDRGSMSWSAQAAFDRGSFATLLGLVVSSSKASVRVFAIGDSIAVLADGGKMVASFPYESPEEFSRNPLLLSTDVASNARIVSKAPFADFRKTWGFSKLRRPNILCMTDALGAWLLCAPNERIPKLLAIRTKLNFAGFVENERSAGRLKRDDTTLLIVG
jgi:hypothetical protein